MLITRMLARVALGAVLAFGLATSYSSSAGAADPIVGTWSGTAVQPGWGSYEVIITLTSPSAGSSSYPSLNCGGRLSGGRSGGAYHFSETIAYGRPTETSDGCIDGSIEMIVRGDTVDWSWSGSWQGESISASGTLFRSGPASAKGNWSPGSWVRGISVANLAGLCTTTWSCQPSSSIMRSSDSRLLCTPNKVTRGACQVTKDPKSCGRCLSNAPSVLCEYCVEPNECSNPNLGWRSREALGCCE